jgi:hypothetical protein
MARCKRIWGEFEASKREGAQISVKFSEALIFCLLFYQEKSKARRRQKKYY